MSHSLAWTKEQEAKKALAAANAPPPVITHAVDPLKFDVMSKAYLKKFELGAARMPLLLQSAVIAAYRKAVEDMQKSLDFATVKE